MNTGIVGNMTQSTVTVGSPTTQKKSYGLRGILADMREFKRLAKLQGGLVPQSAVATALGVNRQHVHRGVAGEKRPVQTNMHTLAWREQPFRLGIVLAPELIAERPGRIDNTAGLQVMFPSRLLIPEFQAGDHSGFILGQAQDAGLIQEAGAALCCGLREVDEQTAIVKLTIVVKHTAAQAVAL